MARGGLDPLIPALAAVPDAWLAEAEVSVGAADGRYGISFFADTAEIHRRQLAAFGLPAEVAATDHALRERFDLVPRWWFKLSYRDGQRVGLSQYFLIDRRPYPISTLRVFCRRYGAPVENLEAMLRPALDDPESSWGLALKYGDGSPRPRVFTRVARTRLPSLLVSLRNHRVLAAPAVEHYRLADRRCGGGEWVWLSLDPGLDHGVSVDFEGTPAEPSTGLGVGSGAARYLKCRVAAGADVPDWVVYRPLRELDADGDSCV